MQFKHLKLPIGGKNKKVEVSKFNNDQINMISPLHFFYIFAELKVKRKKGFTNQLSLRSQ